MTKPNVIEMHDITKKFGEFVANDHINLDVRQGEIHALLGENGAGKSTLMNMLSGLLQPTSGTIKVKGQEVTIDSPSKATKLGIGMVHQHFMLVEAFTVAENIILGSEVTKAGGVLDMKKAIKEITELSESCLLYTSSLYPDAKYLVIAINTTQLEEATERYVKLIVIMMSFFWLLSVAASMYLAKWSRRPIQESLEKQKAFVENASHELRTPLAVIQNRLEVLFRKPESTILDNSENIASSLDEVRNMRLLTTNLLNLARRDDGIKPEIETLEPAFFDTVFTNYAMIAEENEKGFTAQNQVSRPIQTDKTLLKQLMTILFDNAIKYTEDDGHVTFTVRTNDRQLYISVADNGPGISDSDKKKIFDRFYRVDKARTRQKGGFGLGLSLAQQIVLALKGTIVVKDNQPKGTIFEVKITGV